VPHTGCLLATIDNEIGEIGPGPQGCGENPGVPAIGLYRGVESGHTSFSPSTVDPPQPSGSASSGPIFACNAGSPAHNFCALGQNAIRPSSVNRP
jgi:hypothetical protein